VTSSVSPSPTNLPAKRDVGGNAKRDGRMAILSISSTRKVRKTRPASSTAVKETRLRVTAQAVGSFKTQLFESRDHTSHPSAPLSAYHA
jgi:hypothetical protein